MSSVTESGAVKKMERGRRSLERGGCSADQGWYVPSDLEASFLWTNAANRSTDIAFPEACTAARSSSLSAAFLPRLYLSGWSSDDDVLMPPATNQFETRLERSGYNPPSLRGWARHFETSKSPLQQFKLSAVAESSRSRDSRASTTFCRALFEIRCWWVGLAGRENEKFETIVSYSQEVTSSLMESKRSAEVLHFDEECLTVACRYWATRPVKVPLPCPCLRNTPEDATNLKETPYTEHIPESESLTTKEYRGNSSETEDRRSQDVRPSTAVELSYWCTEWMTEWLLERDGSKQV